MSGMELSPDEITKRKLANQSQIEKFADEQMDGTTPPSIGVLVDSIVKSLEIQEVKIAELNEKLKPFTLTVAVEEALAQVKRESRSPVANRLFDIVDKIEDNSQRISSLTRNIDI